MKKLIVILIVTSLLIGTPFAVAAVSQRIDSEKKITTQENVQEKTAPEKKDQPKETTQDTRHVNQLASYIPFSGFTKCVGPDGGTAYAPKKDCENLWNYWDNHKSNTPNNTHSILTYNNTTSTVNTSSSNDTKSTPTIVPTQEPSSTPIPTIMPTLTQIPTPTCTPSPIPTAVPTATPIPTIMPTVTQTPTSTPTPSPLPTATPTETPAPTQAPTITPIPTHIIVPTPIPSVTPQKNTLAVSYFEIPSGGEGLGIINGSDGNLWFAVDRTGSNMYQYPENIVLAKPVVGSIGTITANGEITELMLPTSSNLPLNTAVGEFMFNISAGSDGSVWFTQPNAGIIGNVSPDWNITEYVSPDNSYAPRQVTVGNDGTILFTDLNNGLVNMDTNGTILAQDASLYGVSLLTDSNGNMWVGASSTITRVATDGAKMVVNTSGRTVEMINGTANDVWFSQNGGYLSNLSADGVLTMYQTVGNQAWRLTMDMQNNIWFTDYDNSILQLNTSTGIMSSYLMEESFFANDLVTGPDGNIWFTSDGKIGKIDISTASEVSFTTVVPTVVQIPNGDPKIEKITVLPCTSSSCNGITTIIVEGQNFASDAQITLSGKNNFHNTYNSSYNGQVVNRVGTTKIIIDMQNIVCDQYGVNVYSPSTNKYTIMSNVDLAPYTCH